VSYVVTFVTVTILLSADFWLVKNVSGRLLGPILRTSISAEIFPD
jgi:hypothetical protein